MEAAATETIVFEPRYEIVEEINYDTLHLPLPGFNKEHLRVKIKSGALIISGQMPVEDNKFKSFQTDYSISANHDIDNITAMFKDGILYVKLPKLNVLIKKADERTTPPITTEEPSAIKTNQERHKTVPSKPVQNEEAKSTKNKQNISEPGGIKKDEIEKRDNIYDNEHKARETIPAKIDADQSAKKGVKADGSKMRIVVAVFYVIALGMFINKMHAWFSRKDDN